MVVIGFFYIAIMTITCLLNDTTCDYVFCYLLKGKGSILCRFCRKDLGHGCRIRCAQCDSFDLCLACFSAGIKLVC